ncbi:MAG: class SAM-dependent methyltransferase [Herbinix sp.]|jgi:16S rRNA (guanine1207-N2)-methyltransferase|nr:class SAM-dependent methyltransferase [Herbinix sp.]
MIEYFFNNQKYNFEVDPSLFSPKRIDRGTECLLERVVFTNSDKVLDLGCGYGVVGILISQFVNQNNVYMSDVSEVAVKLAIRNAKDNGIDNPKVILSNGFSNIIDKDFSIILSNPPYHVDFKIPKEFIENGFRHLKYGGKMYMVTKRREWYLKKLKSVFGGVKVYESDGYYVFEAEKRRIMQMAKQDKKTMSKKLLRKYGKQHKLPLI